MSTRLQQRLDALREEGRAGFVPFIMAGDPSATVTAELLAALPAHGADIIELGMPFSDPTADGPAIQAAGLRALTGGFRLSRLFSLIETFRAADASTPLILMGYANPVFHYGIDAFMQRAAQAGADGLILVDIPAEERAPYHDAAARHGLELIALIAPTSLKDRLERIAGNMSGFLYYIAIKGITGTHAADYGQLARDIGAIRAVSGLPVAAGFGINTREDVAAAAQSADLVVVGSALVRMIEAHQDNPSPHVLALCRELADGVTHPRQ